MNRRGTGAAPLAGASYSGWTPERIELLKKLHHDGLSCSQIAREMGGVTRNGVIGKITRLGLQRPEAARPVSSILKPPKSRFSNGTSGQRAAKPASLIYAGDPRTSPLQKKLEAVRAAQVAKREAVAGPATAPDAPLPERDEAPGLATIFTLGPCMCKWPIGDPQLPNFTFCGRRRSGEEPYCPEHIQVAYKPGQQTKKASANELARSLRKYL